MIRRVGKVKAHRPGARESVVTIALRTPEAAKAINGGARLIYLVTFAVVTVMLASMAYGGAFGDTVHAYIRLTVVIAIAHWAIHLTFRIWQDRSTTVSDRVIVRLGPDRVLIERPARAPVTIETRDEVRFASRPHWLGREEERDERRVNHPVGYEYRDAWEVWCEAGLDVMLVAAVAHEDDARAVVRQLSEEHLFVTRGLSDNEPTPNRAEPA